MRFRCEVLSIEQAGEHLEVKMQGQAHPARPWRSYVPFTVQIPNNARNARAFYTGRIVTLTVEPK